MKLISTNAELNKQLKRLIEKYPHIAIATAWASADTEVFKALGSMKSRLLKPSLAHTSTRRILTFSTSL